MGIFLLLFACGIYENKYSQGIIKTPLDTVFYYPPLNLIWTQLYAQNDFGGIVHSINLHNNLGLKIDSSQVVAMAFKSNNRNLSNIVFISPIKYAKPINAFQPNSVTQIFQKTELNAIVGKEAYLLNAPPTQAISSNGYYLGNFNLFKDSKLTGRGIALGIIDYQGAVNLLPNSLEINRLKGTISESGEVNYDIIGPGNTSTQNGSAKMTVANSILSIGVKLNTSTSDSIAFNLTLVK